MTGYKPLTTMQNTHYPRAPFQKKVITMLIQIKPRIIWVRVTDIPKTGKETAERAIIKAVDKDIKCTIFDLENFKEYSANENGDESIQVYTGTVREYITTH